MAVLLAVPGASYGTERELRRVASVVFRTFDRAPGSSRCLSLDRVVPRSCPSIETEEGLAGAVEQSWVGKQLTIGSAVFTIAAPTPRCGMTTRPQADLEYDSGVLRTIVREAGQNLCVGAHCSQPGEIREGDVVEVA